MRSVYRHWSAPGPLSVHTSLRQFAALAFALSAATSALAAAGSIAGRVVDPDGRPVAGVRLVAQTPLGDAAECTTGGDGRCTIATLADGSYTVVVIASGFQADPIDVAVRGDAPREVGVTLRLSAVNESIVVSAAQVEQPLSRTADAVTVITAADLAAHQIETAGDALRLVPGMSVLRGGGRGALTSLFPRGGGSNYTLVLVDGMRVNDFGGGFDLAHLPADDIDRIEIVRGPQSAVFGSDAIGGVVQIVTKRGGPARGDGLFEAGGEGFVHGAANGAGSRGAWSWGASAEQSRSTGFTGTAPATGERVSNDDWHQTHASGSVGWQPSGANGVVVSGQLTRDERGFPGPYGTNPIGAYTAVDRVSRGIDWTRQVGVRATNTWTPRVRQRIDASYGDIANDFTSPFGLSTSGTRRFDGRVQEDVAFSTVLALSAGLELTDERGRSTYITGAAGEPIAIARQVLGSYGELRYTGSERLQVTAGLRVERLARDRVEPSPDAFPPRPEFPAQTIDSINPKVAATYLLTAAGAHTSTRLRASAGTGIRPPDAFEVAFTDNPDLRPERSRSVDAGIDQQFAAGAYQISATLFVNRFDDLIVTVGRSLQDASRFQTDNIANARARGVEITADARPAARVAVHATYTFLDTETLAVDGLARIGPPPFSVGDPLIRRPRHQASVDVTSTAGRVSMFASLLARSSVLDVEPTLGASGGLFRAAAYAVVHAGASITLRPGLDAYARVINLFDRRYEETLGFPALGRSAVAGVRVAAGR